MTDSSTVIQLDKVSFSYGNNHVLSPVTGTVALLGGSPEKTRIRAGYVPQETSSNKLFPISVWDVVLMGKMGTRGFFHSYTKQDRQQVAAMLEELNIHPLKDKSIGDLSGWCRTLKFFFWTSRPRASIPRDRMNSMNIYCIKTKPGRPSCW